MCPIWCQPSPMTPLFVSRQTVQDVQRPEVPLHVAGVLSGGRVMDGAQRQVSAVLCVYVYLCESVCVYV